MKVINGNNIDILKGYPDSYFDAIVTDPPYGLGQEPNAEEFMKNWLVNGYHEVSGKGFMGKEWDAFVPQPIFWKEVYRVLKPGGHILSFFGTRTYDWGVMAMRFAGFEVRDCIQWLYGSGFPKSHNISKAIDKMYGAKREVIGVSETWRDSKRDREKFGKMEVRGKNAGLITKSATDQAKQWDGWGSALKPANEPIVLARKPLEKGLSIAENVLKWGVGAINIDGCRIGSENRTYKGMSANKPDVGTFRDDNWQPKDIEVTVNGRFPANLILTHHPECECIGTKKIKGQIDKPTNRTEKGNSWNDSNSGLRNNLPKNSGGFGDENGEETIEDWNCHPDCPVKILDEQSGESKSQRSERGNVEIFKKENSWIGQSTERGHNDKGGASRFFYVAKASKSERNEGLDEFEEVIKSDRKAVENIGANNPRNRTGTPKANHHPTVKPIKLMQYLVRLITPPNGIVLDPFCGSGTTGIACKLEGFDFVGLEQDAEYCKIAEARIENTKKEEEQQLKLF